MDKKYLSEIKQADPFDKYDHLVLASSPPKGEKIENLKRPLSPGQKLLR